jgi:hypothetical protein
VNLDSWLWLLVVLGEAVVAGLLLGRRAWRTLPVFLIYSIWTFIGDVTDFAVMKVHASAYFDTYFVTKVIDSALQFCVLVELSWSVFRPFRASLPRNTVWFLGGFVALAGAAIWPFAKDPAFAHFPYQWQMLGRFMQTDALLRVLFFLVLAGCSQLLSIGWRDRELQIATGLGFYSLVAVAVSVFHGHVGATQHYRDLDEMVIGSYLVSLSYWAFSFAQKEAVRREFSPQMQGLLLAVAGAARGSRIALTGSSSGKSRSGRDL